MPNDAIKGAVARLKTSIGEQKKKVDFENQKRIGDTNNFLDDKAISIDSNFFKETEQIAEEILDATELITQNDIFFLQELGMLRVLSSLGLTIGEFTHEVEQVLGAAEIDSKSLLKKLTDRDEEHKIALRLDSNIKRFTTYAAYFAKAVRENISRELTPQNLKAVIGDFVELSN